MDHKEQHHEHHQHEREEHKKEQKEHERQQEQTSGMPVHPMWLLVLGVVLTLVVILVWTFFL